MVIGAIDGLAFAFTSVIATALVGETLAGLSRATLVSCSLATIGGGSLTAGGLRVTQGTAIIPSYGALVGMISGTGVSAATIVNLLAQDGYVLTEYCRLLTFS